MVYKGNGDSLKTRVAVLEQRQLPAAGLASALVAVAGSVRDNPRAWLGFVLVLLFVGTLALGCPWFKSASGHHFFPPFSPLKSFKDQYLGAELLSCGRESCAVGLAPRRAGIPCFGLSFRT